MIFKEDPMKYILLIASIIFIIYPIFGIIKCISAFGSLSNYGVGVLAGGLVLLSAGGLLMSYTLKLFKQKKY
jgi:hypothetical protein